MRLNRLIPQLVALIAVLSACGPAAAGTYFGDVSVGNSVGGFQIGQGTSFVSINISAFGVRDPTVCPSCYSSYNDNYTVEFFSSDGTLLSSQNADNYSYSNMYSSSHGIGAGPVSLSAPTGATMMEIVSNLSISGLLLGGSPLDFGNLTIVSDGSITAATPLPSSFALLAPLLATLGLFGWYRGRRNIAINSGSL